MFKKLKELIFTNPDAKNSVVLEALAIYCEKCKIGFKTKAAKGSHMTHKHKKNE